MLSLRKLLGSAFLVAATCLPLAGLSGCAEGMWGSSVKYHPMVDLQKEGLRQLWERQIPMEPGEKIVHTWRVGDSIYVTSSNAHVTRINASSGTLAWQIDLGNKQYEIFRPADVAGGKNVLIVNRGTGFLVDKQTGDVRLQKRLELAVSTDPLVTGNLFCVGGVNYFHALYLDVLGGQKWVTPAPSDVFTARPTVEGDTVLLASESGKLWRINMLTGDWMWKDRQANGRVVGGLAADSRALYVPCLDNNVYAFELSSGAFLWNRPLEGRLDQALSTTRSEVLVPAAGKGLYALNNTRGDIKWVALGVSQIGTIVRDHVWVTDVGGNLLALSLDNGEALSNTPTGASAVTNQVDQNVILVNNSGVLAAYTPMK